MNDLFTVQHEPPNNMSAYVNESSSMVREQIDIAYYGDKYSKI